MVLHSFEWGGVDYAKLPILEFQAKFGGEGGKGGPKMHILGQTHYMYIHTLT